MADAKKPTHKASFSRDKLRGGYQICVEGPQCNRFAGRVVPVSMLDGGKKEIKLLEVQSTTVYEGKNLAFYTFERDRDTTEEIEF